MSTISARYSPVQVAGNPSGAKLSKTVSMGCAAPIQFGNNDAQTKASQPDKTTKAVGKKWRLSSVAKGTRWYFYLLALLPVLLATNSNKALDTISRAVGVVRPDMDDSQKNVYVDANPALAKWEAQYASSFFALHQKQDQWLQNLPGMLDTYFEPTPGLAHLKQELTAFNGAHQAKLQAARQGLQFADGLAVTPENIVNNKLKYDDPIQVQRRDAYFAYIQALNEVAGEAGTVVNKVTAPVRFKRAQSLYDFMVTVEKGYQSNLYKPLSEKPEDVQPFEAGRTMFFEQTDLLHRLHNRIEEYGVTLEQVMLGKAFTPALEPTLDEQAFIYIAAGVGGVKTEADARKLVEIHLKLEQDIVAQEKELNEQAAKPGADSATIQQMAMQLEGMKEALPRGIRMLLHGDPRESTVLLYQETTGSLFRNFVLTSPKFIEQRTKHVADKALRYEEEDRQLGTHKMDEVVQNRQALVAMHEQARLYAALWNNPSFLPEGHPVRREAKQFDAITDGGMQALTVQLSEAESGYKARLPQYNATVHAPWSYGAQGETQPDPSRTPFNNFWQNVFAGNWSVPHIH